MANAIKKEFFSGGPSVRFLSSLLPTPAYSLFGPFSGHEHGSRDQHVGCYSADPPHHALEGIWASSTASQPHFLPPKGCWEEGTPLTTPFPAVGLKNSDWCIFITIKWVVLHHMEKKSFPRSRSHRSGARSEHTGNRTEDDGSVATPWTYWVSGYTAGNNPAPAGGWDGESNRSLSSL